MPGTLLRQDYADVVRNNLLDHVARLVVGASTYSSGQAVGGSTVYSTGQGVGPSYYSSGERVPESRVVAVPGFVAPTPVTNRSPTSSRYPAMAVTAASPVSVSSSSSVSASSPVSARGS